MVVRAHEPPVAFISLAARHATVVNLTNDDANATGLFNLQSQYGKSTSAVGDRPLDGDTN